MHVSGFVMVLNALCWFVNGLAALCLSCLRAENRVFGSQKIEKLQLFQNIKISPPGAETHHLKVHLAQKKAFYWPP